MKKQTISLIVIIILLVLSGGIVIGQITKDNRLNESLENSFKQVANQYEVINKEVATEINSITEKEEVILMNKRRLIWDLK